MKAEQELFNSIGNSRIIAKEFKHEYITPEHLLYSIMNNDSGKDLLLSCNIIIETLEFELDKYFSKLEKINEDNYSTDLPMESLAYVEILQYSLQHAIASRQNVIGIGDMLVAMIDNQNSSVSYILKKSGFKKLTLLQIISHNDLEIESNIENTIENNNTRQTKKSILEKFTTELTSLARKGKLDKFIGRDSEINRTIQILNRKNKNNVIYIGEPGVGKTSIVEGLAQLIIENKVFDDLKDSEIYSLDMGSLIAGTKYRGDFEERIKKVLEEVSKKDKAIIYIDEIHTIIGAGSVSGGSLDAANILKPFLTKSNIKFIGSTTYEEYKQYIEKDKALLRRFQKIEIIEPSRENTFNILKGLQNDYENYHNVKFTDESLYAAIDLSVKYMHDRFLPDKAIDIIDETAAYVKLNSNDNVISIEDIERTLASMVRIPEKTVKNDEKDILKSLSKNLKNNIFGQDEAIDKLVKQIKLSRSGIIESIKPVTNLLFIGSTGVGKTEICKQLSNLLNIPLIRFDMSEYQVQHAADKLIGTPPGYVGFEQGGLLTESIKKNPHCILLLDEIEKAHDSIYNLLLQVMDYATITDNTGKKIDFKNVILIMTSNVGAKNVGKNVIGFCTEPTSNKAMLDEYKNKFSPEFRNRLDDVIVFNKITKDILSNIINKELDKLKVKLAEHDIIINLSDKCFEWIVNKGLSIDFGAREVIRTIQQKITPYFVDKILFNEGGNNILIDIENDEFKFI